MPSIRCTIAAFALLALSTGVRAQPVAEPATLRGESPQTRKRLAEAEQKVLGGKAADAIEELQRILDEAGDDLISVDGKHHRTARWVAHQILAKLPADVLKTYRDRIDEPARKLLDAGKRDRDPRPLWQLLDRYFVSRSADEGSLLLGDLLFERGDFRTAEVIWKRLLPDPDADVNYPGAKTDPAALRARVILAAIFEGETDRAKTDLAAFIAKHPEAKGTFAGKTGPYAETLKTFLERPPQVSAVPVADRTWPTFGGDAARTGRIHGPIPLYWPTRPTWTQAIPTDKIFTSQTRPPFGHPVILNGWGYVSDGLNIFAFELATGTRKKVYTTDRPPAVFDPKPNGEPKAPDPIACPSLTAAHGRLYARIGTPALRAPELSKGGPRADGSSIVCFAPRPGANSPLVEKWSLKPPAVDGKANGVWEGSPLLANGRMWAAFARFEGGRVVHSIACYDPADTDAAPERPAWITEVSDSPLYSNTDVPARARQELIALAGRNVVFCSNAGAVIALDASSGHRAWGVQYSRSNRRLVDSYRSADPAPPVIAGGRVFIAPADAENVFALDAETGLELWESNPVEGAQILGVARNRVIISATGPRPSIRGLSVLDGSHRGDGWIQSNGLLGYGHGLVSDDVVFWPSLQGLCFLDPETGQQLRPALKTIGEGRTHSFGNLAFADGWLIVVTPTQVLGYESSDPPYVRPPDPDPRRPFQALIDRAERDLANGKPEAAREALMKAARGDFPKACRAWAVARLLMLTPPTEDVRELLAPELLGEWLLTSDGQYVSLRMLADRRAGRPAPPRGSPSAPTLPADRKPLDAPNLDADVRIASSFRLPAGSYPLQTIAGASASKHAFIASPRELLAVSLADESQTHHAPGEFTHAADLTEGFVAAGPFTVAVYGDSPWVFRIPDTDPLPGSVPRAILRGEATPPPEMSCFALAGDWLIARLGEHHLIALDLKGKCVAWILGTHGQPRLEPILFPTAPRFTPVFYTSERLLAVQLSDGRRWMVQVSTGRVWSEKGSTFKTSVPEDFGTKTALLPWQMPPVEIDGGFAFSDGPGIVRFTSPAAGWGKRSYEAPGESSLAGDPPQVRRWGDVILAAVRRNYGVELDRIEPSDAKSAWTGGAVVIETSRIDLAAADADPQRVFIPAGHKLLAFGLDDGKAIWDAKLPCDAKWIVRAGRKSVIVYPAEAIPDESLDAAWDRLSGSFLRNPRPWRLPWLAADLYDSWTDRTLPVLLFDPETGKLLKTLRLPAHGPCVSAWLEDGLVAFATGKSVCLLK